MKALLVFSPENSHPLAFLLNRKRRHVFVCLRTDLGWVLYDWRMGLPIVEPCAAREYDLAGFYRDQGLEVLEIETGTHTGYGPLMMNNCVGHAKLLIGASSFALVPNGLYQHFTRRSSMNRLFDFLRKFSFIPGFGGSDISRLNPMRYDPITRNTAPKKLQDPASVFAERKEAQRQQVQHASRRKQPVKTLLSTDDQDGGTLT